MLLHNYKDNKNVEIKIKTIKEVLMWKLQINGKIMKF